MVVVTIGYVCVQEMVARLAAHTGKGLAALIREQFSLRLSAFAVFAFAIANLGLVVTEFAGIASAFELWGVSRYLSVPIAAVAIWLLVIVGSYRYAERVFLLLTLAFVTYPIAMVLGHPDWKQVGAPHRPAPRHLVQGLPAGGRGPHRHHHHPLHPALHGRARWSTGASGPTSTSTSGSTPSRGDRLRPGLDVHHHRHRHGRSWATRRSSTSAAEAARALEAAGRASSRRCCSASACWGLGPGRGRGAPVHLLRGGRGGRRGALGVQELPGGAALPRACSPPRSSSAPAWSCSPATCSS